MLAHGRSTLACDEDGWVLDRLKGLERVIPHEFLLEALEATDRHNVRKCMLSHDVTLSILLGMALLTRLPFQQVYRHSRRLRSDEKTPKRSTICEARKRLGVEPLVYLHQRVVRPLATPDTPGAFYEGYRLMGIDGMLMDVPDRPATEAAFGRPSNGGGSGAFPQVRKVSLVELGTHVEVAFVAGGCREGERTLARRLWDQIPADALLLQDRGFFRGTDWISLDQRGVKLLCRLSKNVVLKPIKTLKDQTYLAKIYSSEYARHHDRDGVVVRVIRYTIHDPQRTGHQEEHLLLTNLLDIDQHPWRELVGLYHERWEQESVNDEQKTHQDPRRAEKPAQLRSETPAGIQQELYALSLGHFVIRKLMFEAAREENLDVDRLSFTGCFQLLQCRLPECQSHTPQAYADWLAGLYRQMREERLPPRRNRINPRVIKRQQSKWPRKRAHHRDPPTLQKTFAESVVQTN